MKWNVALFVGVIIPTYEILSFVVSLLSGILKRFVVHTPLEHIAYNHYKLHRAGQGHVEKLPIDCNDGDCVKLK